MTPLSLRTAGRALYGRLWVVQLAEELGINRRSVQRWAAGQYGVPDTVAEAIQALCVRRGGVLLEVAKELRVEASKRRTS